MEAIPNDILTEFNERIAKRFDTEPETINALVNLGLIKTAKIRAYMICKVLYPRALAQGATSRTSAAKIVARWIDLSAQQVLNVLSNSTRY